jgi:hypothetical protein
MPYAVSRRSDTQDLDALARSSSHSLTVLPLRYWSLQHWIEKIVVVVLRLRHFKRLLADKYVSHQMCMCVRVCVTRYSIVTAWYIMAWFSARYAMALSW